MIGQLNLWSQFVSMIQTGEFPRFIIIVGDRGSGKKLIARKLCKEISNGLYEECGIKIDEIRSLISDVYKIHSLAVYLIPDADNMSIAAKNALLKITEEPPNNSFFIMTLESVNNTLDTIRSRAAIFYMDRYTSDEILEYALTVSDIDEDENCETIKSIIKGSCETPGEVDILLDCGALDFYNYVNLVFDNIGTAPSANVFKIASKIALKDDDEGFDLRLFWKLFCIVGLDRSSISNPYEITQKYGNMVAITSQYLQKAKIRGINKQMLIDMWILDIRKVWLD